MKQLNCILLVDDSKAHNFLHVRLIRNANITSSIKTATNVEDAMTYLANSNTIGGEAYCWPDLILLDVNMNGMNGWEFMEEYRTNGFNGQPSPVIVMLTSSSRPEDKERAGQIPEIAQYCTKPLTRDILDDIMQRFFLHSG